MPEPFDPYSQWLGIPPQEQPPTHYRLLSLADFETNSGKIQSAFDTRLNQVRSFVAGPNSAAAHRVLRELNLARITLLDPRRRAAYDMILHSASPSAILEMSTDGAMPGPAGAAPARPIPINKSGPGEFQAGGSLAKYKILESVASGAHSRTHKVQHTETNRFYFLKFLPTEVMNQQAVVKRFQRECELLIKLDHPNLIVGYESFVQENVRFLVMEYVLGTDLATLVQQQGALPLEDALELTLQVARGLTAMHAQGIYHRNIKPQVLLVDLQGRLRITNLLLAKIGEESPLAGEQLTTMGESLGSVDYLPPEQAVDARQADARSDIYALGCTLFHLLMGRPPFVAKGAMQKVMAHRTQPPPSLTKMRPELPAWLDETFQKMMAKKPADRLQSMEEVIAALDRKPEESWWRRLTAKFRGK